VTENRSVGGSIPPLALEAFPFLWTCGQARLRMAPSWKPVRRWKRCVRSRRRDGFRTTKGVFRKRH
jgi:hypothetical protein